MKRYTPHEIAEFLKAIDNNLTTKETMIIIGGTAAALAYKYSGGTTDIDTYNSVQRIESAVEKAKTQTGFDIPVTATGIVNPPHDFEDRLQPYNAAQFKNLNVMVPEAIDLIIMKSMRAEAHDLQAIEVIAREEKIDSNAILDRYLSEMNESTKNESDRDFNIEAVIEHCFGKTAGANAREKIDQFRKLRKQRKR
jgi:hypothetical protein